MNFIVNSIKQLIVQFIMFKNTKQLNNFNATGIMRQSGKTLLKYGFCEMKEYW